MLPAIVEPPKFEFFPAVGPRSHGPLDPAAIVNAVLEGVQAVNQKDATAYAVARIRLPSDDTPPESPYQMLAAAIVERLHLGGFS